VEELEQIGIIWDGGCWSFCRGAKESEGCGGRELLWLSTAAAGRGDLCFGNEHDKEKWKLMCTLCMYREFI
jgi:hypothetical protein